MQAHFVGMRIYLDDFFCSAKANASGILYQFSTPFPGDLSATGMVDASFVNVTPGTVLLTITNVNFASGEFVKGGGGAGAGLFFNVNPSDNPTNLIFTLESENGSYIPTVSTGENAFKADGDGYYDIEMDFSGTSFSVNSSLTYQITGVANLTAADFEYESAPGGGSGPFYAAAHVQGLPPNGSNSTWIEPGDGPVSIVPVPEPGPASFFGGVIGLLAALRLRSQLIRKYQFGLISATRSSARNSGELHGRKSVGLFNCSR
jgi:hypothetical protein